MRNNGFKNERDFVNFFNKKYLYEFDSNTQEFLTNIFDGTIDNSEPIICYKNKKLQKADIFIQFKKYTKGISIKSGHYNSVSQEPVKEFERFLINLNIPYKVIDYYLSFHYGYRRNSDGTRDYSKKLSSEDYRLLYQDEVDIFNKYINKTKIIIEMVDRFVIRGRNSKYDIDALICGTPDKYVWINKYDLYDLFLDKKCLNYKTPHISCLTIGPKKRCLTTENKTKDRYEICVKWVSPENDIKGFKEKQKTKKTH